MQQVHNNHELCAQIKIWKQQRKTIAFVPTMGNLHQGHLSLLHAAHEQADKLVSSIFVNPMQFGPNEDLSKYPRTLEQDCKALMEHGCDLVYLPTEKDLYPQGLAHITSVQVPDVTRFYEGESRPGHLTGVSTIVLKLFNLVQPDLAVFGKKDYQQLQMIKKMVRDLNLPVGIIGGETVREKNGLAMSSRNQYLSASERQQSAALYQQLGNTAKQIRAGSKDFAQLCQDATEALSAQGFAVDYFDVCSQKNLQPAVVGEALVIVCAARLGNTRLIDNIEI
ncbi:MAG: pantoate--beta-alanine ligase [Gammaproteobacteria bacterium]|nr:pantoate--beta-alanine ligase [Gammaproteobacteria bacterium]MBL6999766.1 pantoate--beta-alanine ligase [Gammaproteobacteria bacterium]